MNECCDSLFIREICEIRVQKKSEVDTEVVSDELDDDGREETGTWDHTEATEFRLEGLAPFVEGVDTHAGLIGQLLFGHCFHFRQNNRLKDIVTE